MIIRRSRPAIGQPAWMRAIRGSTDYVAKLLENVKNESGRLAKRDLLCMLRDESDVALRVMKAVFDPKVTYGIKKLPGPIEIAGNELTEFTPVTWAILDRLASRDLTGNAASDKVALELGSLTPASRDLFTMIIQKNLRAGFSADVVNDVWGPVIAVVKIQLANNFFVKRKKGDKGPRQINPKARFPGWMDVKYDGVRGFNLSDEDLGFFSRAGLPLETPPTLNHLVDTFLKDVSTRLFDGLPLLLDCEIVPMSGGFKDVMSQVRASKRGASEGTTGIRIIDIITKAEYQEGKSDWSHKERREMLEGIVAAPWFAKYAGFISLTEGREVADAEDALRFYTEAQEGGAEGGMFKDPEGYWEGKRTDGWLKLKGEEETTGVFVGWKPGDPGSKWEDVLGSALMRLPSGVIVAVSGMTDEVRQWIFYNIDMLIGEAQEADIYFHEYTPDGSLRHPRLAPGFIRDDK